MSPDVDDLVQTSNNLARVLVKDGKYEVLCLTRSSVDTEKMDLAQAIRSAFELIGAEVKWRSACVRLPCRIGMWYPRNQLSGNGDDFIRTEY